MNKLNSFCIAALIAIVTLIVYRFVPGKGPSLGDFSLTPFLIYWYMVWKLLHDKRKD